MVMQSNPENFNSLGTNKSPLNEVCISVFLVQVSKMTARCLLSCSHRHFKSLKKSQLFIFCLLCAANKTQMHLNASN